MVFPWKPPSLSGKHTVSTTFSFQEDLKQGSLSCCGNHTGVQIESGSVGEGREQDVGKVAFQAHASEESPSLHTLEAIRSLWVEGGAEMSEQKDKRSVGGQPQLCDKGKPLGFSWPS